MGQQTEDSEEITVVKRQFVIVVHKRQKYRCRCNASVQTAPGPLKLIPGGRYSLAFAVEVAIAKVRLSPAAGASGADDAARGTAHRFADAVGSDRGAIARAATAVRRDSRAIFCSATCCTPTRPTGC